MSALGFQTIQCPYCGEWIELAVDPTAAGQAYVEDCSVCCRPIEIRQSDADGGDLLEVRRDDA